jgi:hypothetical protein
MRAISTTLHRPPLNAKSPMLWIVSLGPHSRSLHRLRRWRPHRNLWPGTWAGRVDDRQFILCFEAPGKN